MRYLCFVKMDETDANPPKALMDAMGEHVGEGFASGVLVDAGGLYGKADAVEFRVSGGNLAVTDGPYAEAAEQLTGFYVIESDDLDDLLKCVGRLTADEGRVEVRAYAGGGM